MNARSFFGLPSRAAHRALLDALGEVGGLRVTAEAPAFIDVWERADQTQVHVVNYADVPQTVTVDFGEVLQGTMISPGWEGERRFEGSFVQIMLDLYAIFLIEG